jgi:hypothetical protein
MNKIYVKISNTVNSIIIILTVILISSASVLSSNNTFLISFTIALLLIIVYLKKHLDAFIVYFLIIWSFINLGSYFYNNTIFNTQTFTGFVFRSIIPYLVLKIVGLNFWIKFEKYIFILTIISLILFCLEQIFPSLFNNLQPIFSNFTNEVFNKKENQSNYWYSFFYTHMGREEIRNAGYMWEPGAFALISIWAITFNLLRSNFALTLRIFLYIIAIISTFSTMGYLSLSILIVIYLLFKKYYKLLIAITLLPLLTTSITNLSFLKPKLDNYLSENKENTAYLQEYSDRYEVNRITTFMYDMKKFSNYPLGYGIIDDEETYNNPIKIVGVNGISRIIVMWGIIGIIVLIIGLFRYLKDISSKRIENKHIVLLMIPILMGFFSNPIEKNPFLFLIIFTPFLREFKYLSILKLFHYAK